MSTTPIKTYAGQGVSPAIYPEDARTDACRLAAGTYAAGTAIGQLTSVTGQSAVQTLTVTGTPTGGTVRYQFGDQVTAAIAYNAAAAAVQAAFEALSNIGTGNVAVTGGPGPGTPWVLTFQNQMAKIPVVAITLYANSLTGGSSPTSTIAQTTPGRYDGRTYAAYNDANSDGSDVAKAILKYATVVDNYGKHTVGGGEWGTNTLSAPAYFAGFFRTVDIVGIDANGVADLGGPSAYHTGNSTLLANTGTIIKVR